MNIITISREFGSGGRELGSALPMHSVLTITTGRSSHPLQTTEGWIRIMWQKHWSATDGGMSRLPSAAPLPVQPQCSLPRPVCCWNKSV